MSYLLQSWRLGVDLRDMLDRAVAAKTVIESPGAKPLREHARLTDAMECCRKAADAAQGSVAYRRGSENLR